MFSNKRYYRLQFKFKDFNTFMTIKRAIHVTVVFLDGTFSYVQFITLYFLFLFSSFPKIAILVFLMNQELYHTP